VDERLRIAAGQLRHVLPALTAAREIVVGVLHPEHGHVLRAGLVDKGGDVRDDAIAVIGTGQHAVLDVDNEQRGVRPIRQGRHGNLLFLTVFWPRIVCRHHSKPRH
jgi:hypothetical protein